MLLSIVGNFVTRRESYLRWRSSARGPTEATCHGVTNINRMTNPHDTSWELTVYELDPNTPARPSDSQCRLD